MPYNYKNKSIKILMKNMIPWVWLKSLIKTSPKYKNNHEAVCAPNLQNTHNNLNHESIKNSFLPETQTINIVDDFLSKPIRLTPGSASFPGSQNHHIIALMQWQYWWWFWFSMIVVLYYSFSSRLVSNRLSYQNPKIVTTYRSHGRWGDLIICAIPIFWCVNILSSSHFLLRALEWQTETAPFTLRVRGKQWYWIYKFDLNNATHIDDLPKLIGYDKKVFFQKTNTNRHERVLKTNRFKYFTDTRQSAALEKSETLRNRSKNFYQDKLVLRKKTKIDILISQLTSHKSKITVSNRNTQVRYLVAGFYYNIPINYISILGLQTFARYFLTDVYNGLDRFRRLRLAQCTEAINNHTSICKKIIIPGASRYGEDEAMGKFIKLTILNKYTFYKLSKLVPFTQEYQHYEHMGPSTCYNQPHNHVIKVMNRLADLGIFYYRRSFYIDLPKNVRDLKFLRAKRLLFTKQTSAFGELRSEAKRLGLGHKLLRSHLKGPNISHTYGTFKLLNDRLEPGIITKPKHNFGKTWTPVIINRAFPNICESNVYGKLLMSFGNKKIMKVLGLDGYLNKRIPTSCNEIRNGIFDQLIANHKKKTKILSKHAEYFDKFKINYVVCKQMLNYRLSKLYKFSTKRAGYLEHVAKVMDVIYNPQLEVIYSILLNKDSRLRSKIEQHNTICLEIDGTVRNPDYLFKRNNWDLFQNKQNSTKLSKYLHKLTMDHSITRDLYRKAPKTQFINALVFLPNTKKRMCAVARLHKKWLPVKPQDFDKMWSSIYGRARGVNLISDIRAVRFAQTKIFFSWYPACYERLLASTYVKMTNGHCPEDDVWISKEKLPNEYTKGISKSLKVYIYNKHKLPLMSPSHAVILNVNNVFTRAGLINGDQNAEHVVYAYYRSILNYNKNRVWFKKPRLNEKGVIKYALARHWMLVRFRDNHFDIPGPRIGINNLYKFSDPLTISRRGITNTLRIKRNRHFVMTDIFEGRVYTAAAGIFSKINRSILRQIKPYNGLPDCTKETNLKVILGTLKNSKKFAEGREALELLQTLTIQHGKLAENKFLVNRGLLSNLKFIMDNKALMQHMDKNLVIAKKRFLLTATEDLVRKVSTLANCHAMLIPLFKIWSKGIWKIVISDYHPEAWKFNQLAMHLDKMGLETPKIIKKERRRFPDIQASCWVAFQKSKKIKTEIAGKCMQAECFIPSLRKRVHSLDLSGVNNENLKKILINNARCEQRTGVNRPHATDIESTKEVKDRTYEILLSMSKGLSTLNTLGRLNKNFSTKSLLETTQLNRIVSLIKQPVLKDQYMGSLENHIKLVSMRNRIDFNLSNTLRGTDRVYLKKILLNNVRTVNNLVATGRSVTSTKCMEAIRVYTNDMLVKTRKEMTIFRVLGRVRSRYITNTLVDAAHVNRIKRVNEWLLLSNNNILPIIKSRNSLLMLKQMDSSLSKILINMRYRYLEKIPHLYALYLGDPDMIELYSSFYDPVKETRLDASSLLMAMRRMVGTLKALGRIHRSYIAKGVLDVFHINHIIKFNNLLVTKKLDLGSVIYQKNCLLIRNHMVKNISKTLRMLGDVYLKKTLLNSVGVVQKFDVTGPHTFSIENAEEMRTQMNGTLLNSITNRSILKTLGRVNRESLGMELLHSTNNRFIKLFNTELLRKNKDLLSILRGGVYMSIWKQTYVNKPDILFRMGNLYRKEILLSIMRTFHKNYPDGYCSGNDNTCAHNLEQRNNTLIRRHRDSNLFEVLTSLRNRKLLIIWFNTKMYVTVKEPAMYLIRYFYSNYRNNRARVLRLLFGDIDKKITSYVNNRYGPVKKSFSNKYEIWSTIGSTPYPSNFIARRLNSSYNTLPGMHNKILSTRIVTSKPSTTPNFSLVKNLLILDPTTYTKVLSVPINYNRWVGNCESSHETIILEKNNQESKNPISIRFSNNKKILRNAVDNTNITIKQKKIEKTTFTSKLNQRETVYKFGPGKNSSLSLHNGEVIIKPNYSDEYQYDFKEHSRSLNELDNMGRLNKSYPYQKRLLWVSKQILLPTHTAITIITNSYDVIHSWFIPGLGLKMDCVPGRSTHHTIYVEHTGYYYGQCAEVCGRRHHHMPIKILAVPLPQFIYWWKKNIQPYLV